MILDPLEDGKRDEDDDGQVVEGDGALQEIDMCECTFRRARWNSVIVLSVKLCVVFLSMCCAFGQDVRAHVDALPQHSLPKDLLSQSALLALFASWAVPGGTSCSCM